MNMRNKYYAISDKRSYKKGKFNAQVKLFFYLLLIVGLLSCKEETDPDNIYSIPTKYDLREYNLITPVRNQNGVKPYGTSDMGSTVGLCWAFSSLASLESNMLKQGITSNTIKGYIKEHGAIQSFIHLEAIDFPGMISQIVNGVEYTYSRFMDKVNYNMFTYETNNFGTSFFTHAIAIIGWDDNCCRL